MIASDVLASEYASFYKPYVLASGSVDLFAGLQEGLKHTVSFFNAIPQSKQLYCYEAGKWTIKELLEHLMDAERVFAYRAMRIARGDKTPLPGFDENKYVASNDSNSKPLSEIIEAYALQRKSTIALFKGFSQEALIRIGIVSDTNVSVRALGFLIIGHEIHHKRIIKERYL